MGALPAAHDKLGRYGAAWQLQRAGKPAAPSTEVALGPFPNGPVSQAGHGPPHPRSKGLP